MIELSRRKALFSCAAGFGAAVLPSMAAGYETALPADIAAGEPATITNGRRSSPLVAMTYDDGPHPTLTPKLLDELKKRQLRATFFLIGRSVVTWPDIVRRIADEGHEIGNHTWSHPNMERLSHTAAMREIDRTTEAIYEITGRAPVTFRPPYGAFTSQQRQRLYETRALPTVLWSVDPFDWRHPGANVVKQRILEASTPGSIILTHDIHRATVRAMPGTFDGLTGRGLRFGTLSQLLGWPLWQAQGLKRAGDHIATTGRPDLVALQ